MDLNLQHRKGFGTFRTLVTTATESNSISASNGASQSLGAMSTNNPSSPLPPKQLKSSILSPRQKSELYRPTETSEIINLPPALAQRRIDELRNRQMQPLYTYSTAAPTDVSARTTEKNRSTEQLITLSSSVDQGSKLASFYLSGRDFDSAEPDSPLVNFSRSFASNQMEEGFYSSVSIHDEPSKLASPFARGAQYTPDVLPNSPFKPVTTTDLLKLAATTMTSSRVSATSSIATAESRDPAFFHVTPRFNVEDVLRRNFYDLVIIELPGECLSGLVWNKGQRRKRSKGLPRSQLMQLSAKGLLYYSGGNDDEPGEKELVSVQSLLREKEQLEKLRLKTFFGHFMELKVVRSWRHYTRRQRFQKAKRKISESTVFSGDFYVKIALMIAKDLQTMESAVEMVSQSQYLFVHFCTVIIMQS
jgi:hypothetical protein